MDRQSTSYPGIHTPPACLTCCELAHSPACDAGCAPQVRSPRAPCCRRGRGWRPRCSARARLLAHTGAQRGGRASGAPVTCVQLADPAQSGRDQTHGPGRPQPRCRGTRTLGSAWRSQWWCRPRPLRRRRASLDSGRAEHPPPARMHTTAGITGTPSPSLVMVTVPVGGGALPKVGAYGCGRGALVMPGSRQVVSVSAVDLLRRPSVSAPAAHHQWQHPAHQIATPASSLRPAYAGPDATAAPQQQPCALGKAYGQQRGTCLG